MSVDTLPAELDLQALADRLPSFPPVVLQLLDLLRADDATLDDLAQLARADAAISARILATANYVRRQRAQSDVRDLQAAAAQIGFNQLRNIVVRAGMNQFLEETRGVPFFFPHSQAVALIAEELARLTGVCPHTAYICGILHDVGQLGMQVLDARACAQLVAQAEGDADLLQQERAYFGLDHCQIGAQLATLWQLPPDMVQAIGNHHAVNAVDAIDGPLLAVLYLAEVLARALDLPPSPRNRVRSINGAALGELNLVWDSADMRDCLGRCRARVRHALAASQA